MKIINNNGDFVGKIIYEVESIHEAIEVGTELCEQCIRINEEYGATNQESVNYIINGLEIEGCSMDKVVHIVSSIRERILGHFTVIITTDITGNETEFLNKQIKLGE